MSHLSLSPIFPLVVSSPSTAEQNEGVEIMLQYSRVRLNTTLEAMAVKILSNEQYTICSLYLSSNAIINKEEVRDLIHQLPRSFFVK